MALNVGRWLRYAQAKVSDVVRSAEQDVARREAAREVEQADKPWLGDDAEAPSLEATRARIAWEAEQAEAAGRERTEDDAADPSGDEAADQTTDAARPSDASDRGGDASTVDLERFGTGAAEAAQARIELDKRAADSAARLEAIRRELGVDEPDDAS